jgi:putative acetyltransferase
MYTKQAARGKGLVIIVLKELEAWAKENSYTSSVLETGFKQPEAIALYKKNGYSLIPNYGQ